MNLSALGTAAAIPTSLPGLLLAAASNKTVTLPNGQEVPAYTALLTALENQSDVNVLSAPNIVTTDNEEAEIVVGRNVPFVASRATARSNLSNLFTTIERHDVGITLRMTPQIIADDYVHLTLFEEVSDIDPLATRRRRSEPGRADDDLRSASTVVGARDGQTVVIGGLLSDTVRRRRARRAVPEGRARARQPLPARRHRRVKTNLLVFLTPHVIATDAQMAENSLRERDAHAGAARGAARRCAEPARGRHAEGAPEWMTPPARPRRRAGSRSPRRPRACRRATCSRALPMQYARRHLVLPLGRGPAGLDVAVADPLALAPLDDLRFLYGSPVRPLVVPAAALRDAIARAYDAARRRRGRRRLVARRPPRARRRRRSTTPSRPTSSTPATRRPAIRLVNALLYEAVKAGASDVHVEPYERTLAVRLRIDGVLHDVLAPPRGSMPPLASRVKIMAGLDIAERRLPQDGRIALRVGGRDVDVRVSIVPTASGERVVLRLLDRASVLRDVGGARPHAGVARPTRRRSSARTHGLLLVTGPTGSGKTTTLYAPLRRLATGERNVMTIEDPIEYQLRGIGQMQVPPRIGLTFAAGLRAILRQDPDVILVGEIRDRETVEIALQAALTGHLVLATLHTNDAASALTRLLDMGVEPYLIASSVVGVLAQRLVRRICAACAGGGCVACRRTGFRGRTGIHELLVLDEPARALVMARADAGAIRRHARGRGHDRAPRRRLREGARRHHDGGRGAARDARRGGVAVPVFAYRARTAAGRAGAGSSTPTATQAAWQQLRARGVYPTALREDRDAPRPARRAPRPAPELAAVTRAARRCWSRAGVPVAEALEAAADATEHPRRSAALTRVRARVREGVPLADALGDARARFPPLYRELVRASEAGGALAPVLGRLALSRARRRAARTAARGARLPRGDGGRGRSPCSPSCSSGSCRR